MLDLFKVRQEAEKMILDKKMDSSVLNLILESVLNLSHQEIIIKNINELTIEEADCFFSLVKEYLRNERPIQYILGYTYFYKRKFIVNENVLIPRYETEELVYNALKVIEKYNYQSVIDIGTGSGNIAISLKKEKENLNVIALDISLSCLEVAKKNALNLEAEVDFYESDLLSYLITNNLKVDLIVSNPPYIAYDDQEVDEIVKNNEPHLALFALDYGLYNYKKIIDEAYLVLNKNGSILFEIGYTQGKALKEYALNKYKNIEVKIIQDIAKKDRILFIKFN